MAAIECAGFKFYSEFDSGNLARVEWVPRSESAVVPVIRNGKEIVPEIPDLEFNIWTKPDCVGTEFENANRTWFYFGVKAPHAGALVRLNLVDLNRQAKMYSQGMAPVYRVIPGRPHWDRIRDKATFAVNDNIFTLSFKFKTPENSEAITYFAFTFPYTYTHLQHTLHALDLKFCIRKGNSLDDIYFVRECVCRSLEDRKVDLITISSYYNITTERETRLKDLFPEKNVDRPYKFANKKVIFVSARVHPGETPSSFVFNGLLNMLLTRDDPLGIMLRRMYVFKMIPFLNPDGVAKGHYRTDTRGINLNRMYLNPTLKEHPSVYAARALIRYHHYGFEKEDDEVENIEITSSTSSVNNDKNMSQQVEVLSLEEKRDLFKRKSEPWCPKWNDSCQQCNGPSTSESLDETCALRRSHSNVELSTNSEIPVESGLFLYMDMHGHASKKGIFMYGNHFKDLERNVECMLLPRLMAINNYNFHFNACNFTERNMYLRDRRDGMSREGSGRVAVLKITGLVRSYTLECNYNTGRMVNVLPPTIKEGSARYVHSLPVPPKYTPAIYEEVGRALGASILDLTTSNPQTRLPHSEFHTLCGLRAWLRLNCLNEMGISRSAVRTKSSNTTLSQNGGKSSRHKTSKTPSLKTRPASTRCKRSNSKGRSSSIPVERKENHVTVPFPTKDSNASVQSSSGPLVPKVFSRTKGMRPLSKEKKPRQFSQEATKVPSRTTQVSSTVFNKLKSESADTVKTSPKRIRVSPGLTPQTSVDRLKLREICFIKENCSKKIIAKFISTDDKGSQEDEGDLVVAWKPNEMPRISSRPTSKNISSVKYEKIKSEPSTSAKPVPQSAFKSKRTKGLRRLSSATSNSNKIDKFKKRKKSKIL